jgi:hypothetical protein
MERFSFVQIHIEHRLSKDYIFKGVQNMRSSLELVIQDCDSMCKIFPITIRGSVHAQYNNLEPKSIKGFNDLSVKL